MKVKVSLGLVAMAAVVVILLAAHGSSVRAQSVASVALPAPGAPKDLYAGCNNVALTFPDGTASQTVVQAVTPAGSVESLWRHSGALNKFEGFSPAYPQASDLLTVNFLDAVWLCMTGTPAATAPPPSQPPPPPPPPPPPGPTATATAAPPPGGGSWGILTADLAVTDIFPDNWPNGNLIARVTNHGPDTVSGVTIELGCTFTRTEYLPPHTSLTLGVAPALISPTLNPGQTADFNVHIQVQGATYWYDVTCGVQVPFSDPNPGNNSYSELFPPPP